MQSDNGHAHPGKLQLRNYGRVVPLHPPGRGLPEHRPGVRDDKSDVRRRTRLRPTNRAFYLGAAVTGILIGWTAPDPQSAVIVALAVAAALVLVRGETAGWWG